MPCAPIAIISTMKERHSTSSNGSRGSKRRTSRHSKVRHHDRGSGSRSKASSIDENSFSTVNSSSQYSSATTESRGTPKEENAMSHEQAAKLVEEMMLKQMEISEKTAQKITEMGPSVDDIAESQALASQQEAISSTFANMVHTMIEQLSRQEAEIDFHANKVDQLERKMQKTSEALEFKTSQVNTLQEKMEIQREELLGAYQQNLKREPASRSLASSKSDCSGSGGSEKLKKKLKEKSDELRKVKSTLHDSKFLLQAYKERCEELESKSGGKKSVFPFGKAKREDPIPKPSAKSSSNPELKLRDPPKRRSCDESVDMSLYCM